MTIRFWKWGITATLLVISCAPQKNSACPQAVISTAQSWEDFDKYASEGGLIAFLDDDGGGAACSATLEFVTTTYPMEVVVWTSSHCFQNADFDLVKTKKIGIRLGESGGYIPDPDPQTKAPNYLFIDFNALKARDSFMAALGGKNSAALDDVFKSVLLDAPSSFATEHIDELVYQRDYHSAANVLMDLWPPEPGQNTVADFFGFREQKWDICGSQPEYTKAANEGKMIACSTVADIVAMRGILAQPKELSVAEIITRKAQSQQSRVAAFLSTLSSETRDSMLTWTSALRQTASLWEEEAYARFLDCNDATIRSKATTTCAAWTPLASAANLTQALAGSVTNPSLYQTTDTTVREGVGPHHAQILRRYLDLVGELKAQWEKKIQKAFVSGELSPVVQGNFGFKKISTTLTDQQKADPDPEGFYAIPFKFFHQMNRDLTVDVLTGAIRITSMPKKDKLEMVRSDSGSLFTADGVIPIATLTTVDRVSVSDGFAINDIPAPQQRRKERTNREVDCE